RVSRSTRRYSSSMPTVKLGSVCVPPLPIRRPASAALVMLDTIERRVRQRRLQRGAETVGPHRGAGLALDQVLAHLDEHVGEAAAIGVGMLRIAVAVGAGVRLVVTDGE